MTRYASALSTTAAYAAGAAALSHPPPSSSPAATAAVRLFTLNKQSTNNIHRSATSKVVHLIRHAEGTHNLNESESKLPAHFDATLTQRGIEQCNVLAGRTHGLNVEAVLVSPMTRCLETARLSFPHLYEDEKEIGCEAAATVVVPFVAHEEWRETVNFLCDSRRTKQLLQTDYSRVNFDAVIHDVDPLWERYESIFGCYKTHTSIRESNDPKSLYERAHAAWKVLLNRPERNLALVGHSAFFMHMFTPLYEELEGVVQYGDEGARELMAGGDKFENCEMRSVVVDVPI